MSELLRGALLVALLGGAGLVLLFFVLTPGLAERFVFYPSRVDPGPAPRVAGIAGEDVAIRTADGVTLHSWWFDAGPEAPAVLFLHGNAGTIAGRLPVAEGYVSRGISVLLLGYRGYGRNEGTATEAGVHLDGEAGLAWLGSRVGDPARVVVHGRSLGGAVAARIAADAEARRVPAGSAALGGLILESAFTTLDEMAAAAYPFLPKLLFRRLEGHFDSLEAVANLRSPLLVIHGTRDSLIPVEMGRRLHEAGQARRPDTATGSGPPMTAWYPVEGAGHNDVWWIAGETYFSRLAAFVLQVVPPPGPSGGRP